MTRLNPSEVELELGKAFLRHQELLDVHRWPSEHERWVELVFALIAATGDADQTDLRQAVEQLDELDLLRLETLVQLPVGDADGPAARTIVESLIASGMSSEQSKRALTTICEAAKGLADGFQGKVQKYLRHYGQKMIEELPEHFAFSLAQPAQIRDAFVYWLQNVANMPLSLTTPATRGFCKRFGITEKQLVLQADELDVNLALVDDLIMEEMAEFEAGRKPVNA